MQAAAALPQRRALQADLGDLHRLQEHCLKGRQRAQTVSAGESKGGASAEVGDHFRKEKKRSSSRRGSETRPLVLTLEMFPFQMFCFSSRDPAVRKLRSTYDRSLLSSRLRVLTFFFSPRTASSFHICACSNAHFDHFDHSCYSFLLFIQFLCTGLFVCL